ncbi:hypothetical protein KY285_030484 [Solanum tuberosum]|nr:hypothetical protein KY285_030484 [Solanum tuberosum]
MVVSGSLEHDENLSPPPMELKILELPPEYVQSDQSPTEISTANDSDDDFQDPPRLKNNKGKEKVNSCSSPPKKKSRQTVTRIQKKTPPRVISKQPCLRKSLRHANVPERPKSPLPKRQAKQLSVDQFEELSRHSPSKLNCQSVYNDLNDQESPAGHSGFSPLGQQFNTPEPQVHNNFEIPITFEVQNTSEFPNISEVQNTSEKEDCQDVPIEVNKEGSQFMNDQADFNNSSFDVLNVIYDQTEKMEKEEFTDTNKPGSSDDNKLVVKEVFMCPTPLQMLAYKDQLLDDSHIDIILYYIRKRAKYSKNNDVLRNQLTLFRFKCQTIACSDIIQPRVGIVPTRSDFEN